MTRNVYRDKEQESNVQAIAEAMQLMEVPVRVGWLAPKKLEAADRLGIEKEIAKYAADTGRAKLTEEKAKDWCNVCRVFIEALGKLSPTMQRGALVNMFRVMIDHGGDIKAGIKSYSSLPEPASVITNSSSELQAAAGCYVFAKCRVFGQRVFFRRYFGSSKRQILPAIWNNRLFCRVLL